MRAKRTDKGQAAIVKKLRDAKVPVIVTNFGDDFPDTITDFMEWVLIEIKEIDGDISRGQLQFIAYANGHIGIAIDFDTAFKMAVTPEVYCFTRAEKARIAAWLEKNPNMKTIAVRKFYKEVLNRQI